MFQISEKRGKIFSMFEMKNITTLNNFVQKKLERLEVKEQSGERKLMKTKMTKKLTKNIIRLRNIRNINNRN